MKTVCGMAVLGLLTVLVSATLVKADSDDCDPELVFRACFDGIVFFSNLFEPRFKGYLCSKGQELDNCVQSARSFCDDVHPASDAALTTMLGSASLLCSDPAESVTNEGSCPGGMHQEFRDQLEWCRQSIPWDAEGKQICKALRRTIDRMEELLEEYRACLWMTTDFARGFRFWIDYYIALDVVQYNCKAHVPLL